jgi:molybdenum cofactor guanylyltransferase
LLDFNGRPLVALLIEELERQALAIVINANRNLQRYRSFGYPVINDQLEDYQGPLAGFASAMHAVKTDFILTLPCDGPTLAQDYAARFMERYRRSGAPVIVASDGERLQPVHALIRTDLLPSLNQFLATGDRKIDRWYALHDYAEADFSDQADMFRNINTPSDRQALQAGQ